MNTSAATTTPIAASPTGPTPLYFTIECADPRFNTTDVGWTNWNRDGTNQRGTAALGGSMGVINTNINSPLAHLSPKTLAAVTDFDTETAKHGSDLARTRREFFVAYRLLRRSDRRAFRRAFGGFDQEFMQ